MVAATIYSVTMVLRKETAFPLCRAMERRWKRNVVSRVYSVIVVIRLPISCVSSMAISCHVPAVSMATGYKCNSKAYTENDPKYMSDTYNSQEIKWHRLCHRHATQVQFRIALWTLQQATVMCLHWSTQYDCRLNSTADAGWHQSIQRHTAEIYRHTVYSMQLLPGINSRANNWHEIQLQLSEMHWKYRNKCHTRCSGGLFCTEIGYPLFRLHAYCPGMRIAIDAMSNASHYFQTFLFLMFLSGGCWSGYLAS